MNRARRVLLLAAATLAAMTVMALPGRAMAGQWVQVSCENPNGSTAPSDSWSSSTAGSPEAGSVSSTSCGAGSPMVAYLSANSAAGTNVSEQLDWTAPAGSTLEGGTLDISGYSGGGSSAANATADDTVESPTATYPGGVIFQCENSCGTFSNDTVTIPANQGGGIYLGATCGTADAGAECNTDADAAGQWAEVAVNSADLLLSNSASPTAADFTGTLLSPSGAVGTAQLAFTAAETDGPGVYNVNVEIDGNSVYSATPNTNNGNCVSQGTYSGTSALEFDGAQPCPAQENVDVPVDTTALSNGTHELTVILTDAAGNTATVEDTYITIANGSSASSPVATPTVSPVAGETKVNVQFLASFRFTGSETHFDKITHTKLPKGAKVALSDRGPHRPKLKLVSATGKRVDTLLKDLTKVRFSAGDKLIFTVTAPGEVTERIQVTFRRHRRPKEKLL